VAVADKAGSLSKPPSAGTLFLDEAPTAHGHAGETAARYPGKKPVAPNWAATGRGGGCQTACFVQHKDWPPRCAAGAVRQDLFYRISMS